MHNYGIFGQLKKQVSYYTYYIANKLKENSDAVVVDCHHVACVLCVVTEKKSLIFFLRLGFFQHWEKSHLISIGTEAEF